MISRATEKKRARERVWPRVECEEKTIRRDDPPVLSACCLSKNDRRFLSTWYHIISYTSTLRAGKIEFFDWDGGLRCDLRGGRGERTKFGRALRDDGARSYNYSWRWKYDGVGRIRLVILRAFKRLHAHFSFRTKRRARAYTFHLFIYLFIERVFVKLELKIKIVKLCYLGLGWAIVSSPSFPVAWYPE